MPVSSPDDGAIAPDNENTAAGSEAENTGATDAGASSSPPETAGTMLDAVTAALEPKEASPPSNEPDPDDNADPDAKKAEGESEELSPEELKALSWKAQQRFKRLTSTAKAKDGTIAELQPKADAYDKIVGSITKANLEPSELDELVEIGGMLKSNPQAALEKLAPLVDALRNVVGDVLPADLQERVRLGYISEQDARALHKAQTSQRLTAQQVQEADAQRKAEKEASDRQAQLNASVEAVEAWEKQQADKDPDWHLKRKEVAELVELAIVRKSRETRAPYFPTPEESVQLSKDALKTINERLKRFVPKPAEIRPPAAPGAASRSKPAPKTIREAIDNAL